MFSDPRHNIEQLGLSDGKVVADLGTGSGFYAIEAARAVAPMGKVYAVDIQRGLLDRLKAEANRQHVKNVEIVAGDLEKVGGSKVRESSCDAVIASNILFMIEDRKSFLLEAKRILKQGGRLLLVDWSASFSQMGPHPEHVVYKDDALKLARSIGLEFDREIHAGSHHYGLIFRKA
ncbi:MAG: methyltransferase domain-containing protein [Candidatus Taylorbacteria bacterium]|nr:methyltransferase domain-containing protein [Candidatus Taylorbacteria bacterium]